MSNVRVSILAEVVQNKFDNTNEKMTFTPPSATAETQNLSVRILAGKSNITISGNFTKTYSAILVFVILIFIYVLVKVCSLIPFSKLKGNI